ncbi:heme biosynthesis protein HemY [Segnochrobactraceae bacterium EtOH-i3]
MIRVLAYLLVVFALALGAVWIADRPGLVTIDWLGTEVQTSLVFALVVAVVVLGLAVILALLLSGVIAAPGRLGRFFSRRRRDHGYRALATGMVAVASGDLKLARRYAEDARRLIPDEPAVGLLEAETSTLAGDPEGARARYAAMLDNPDTRVLGLHGLYVGARRSGDVETARRAAGQAAALAPRLGWAAETEFESCVAAGQWEEATRLLDRNRHNRLVDKPAARRQKAVLLAARAQEVETGDPDLARELSLAANKLEPTFVPAAAVAARVLARQNEARKATKVIEAVWRVTPHPDLAAAFLKIRPGESAQERLKRCRGLAELRPDANDSVFLLAEAAISARAFNEARTALRPLLERGPTQKACLIMASLEAAEGDHAREREWLSRAVHAPRDPAWVADGVVARSWAPVSPVSGRLDAFEWKAPAEVASDGPVIDAALFEKAAPAPAPAPAPEAPAAEKVAPEVVAPTKVEILDPAEPEPAEAEPAPEAPAARPSVDPGAHQPDDPGPTPSAAPAPRKRGLFGFGG